MRIGLWVRVRAEVRDENRARVRAEVRVENRARVGWG